MQKQTIAVLFGGCSPEYDISLQSAYAVITHMDRERFSPLMVGISRDGAWFHFHGAPEQIVTDRWCNAKDCTPAMLSPNRGAGRLLRLQRDRVEAIPIDAVFPVLHGENGEDGTVQGLVELAGIPLVGCGTLASALCMDKIRAHEIAESCGCAVPKGYRVARGYAAEAVREQALSLGLPLFVKPTRAGSSLGVTRVCQWSELFPALDVALSYGPEAIMEEAVAGFEVGCAILGNEELLAGGPDEIELSQGFFNFEEKYTLKSSFIHVPARISPACKEAVITQAKTLYRALGCAGFARVDQFVTPDGRLVFNEINTVPGFTDHSRFPMMMKLLGLSLTEVITKIIALAVLPGRAVS